MLLSQYFDIIKTKVIQKANQVIAQSWQQKEFLPFINWCSCQSISDPQGSRRYELTEQMQTDLFYLFQEILYQKELNPQTFLLAITFNINTSPFLRKIERTFRNITQLEIDDGAMGVAGANFIYRADWKHMSKLIFSKNNIGEKGAKILAKCQWSELQALKLDRNNLKNKGFCALLKSNWPKLKDLSLRQNNFTPDMTRAFVKHPWKDLKIVSFQEANQSEFTKALVKIVPVINIKTQFIIQYYCQESNQGAFAVFQHSVTCHPLAKVMNRFSLHNYHLYHNVAFVSKGIVNIKQGGLLSIARPRHRFSFSVFHDNPLISIYDQQY